MNYEVLQMSDLHLYQSKDNGEIDNFKTFTLSSIVDLNNNDTKQTNGNKCLSLIYCFTSVTS